MSLQTKFAVLLAMIGMAVVAGIGAAVWSFDRLASEVSRPLASISAVLNHLDRLKQAVGEARDAVAAAERPPDPSVVEAGPGDPGDAAAALAESAIRQAQEVLDALERGVIGGASAGMAGDGDSPADADWFRAHVGRTALRSLRDRIGGDAGLAGAIRDWTSDRSPAATDRALRAAAAARDLIERTERHVLRIIDQAVRFDRGFRADLLTVLGLAALWAALVSLQGWLLLRRWVTRPVADLRAAAVRIGAGDFDHRVPVSGRDELARLSVEVNHMASLVRAMQDERVERERLAAVGEMIQRLAHNLRSPLSGIRGLADATRADLPRPSQLRENQDRIIAAVDRFERWLRDLLSATTPTRIHPAPTAIRPLLQAVVDSQQPIAKVKDVSLVLETADAPETADVDAPHLEQALVAMVDNAIDASPRGGTVVLSACAMADQGMWEVCVADQGPGVPAELADRVFRPYFTTKRHGTGIGLAVAQQVARSHGGRILVEPREALAPAPDQRGSGARFRLRIPLKQAATGIYDSAEVARNGQLGVASGENPGH